MEQKHILWQVRRKLGLSRKDFASAIGISTTTLKSLEDDLSCGFSTSTICKVMDFLGCGYDSAVGIKKFEEVPCSFIENVKIKLRSCTKYEEEMCPGEEAEAALKKREADYEAD